ncbi:LysR family transcriptional regulator [Streptomyces buecherae]|uniref:LysR family transcriptional regulator n=1 Tax=Streptomyces buecherae TaxID=2763006 RepID=A0A7H8NDT1_9ACTN|nr:LysR family transcriptional regulator [Streptomyces buecherae]QKW52536.1 LysR family transcriptional regulator [Streptomyces buecherae]
MDLEVRHLRFVAAIEAAGSVTKAAANLGVSQPALTAQVRRIESAVGGTLFDRGRHGARPTPLGDVLLPHVRDVLGALEELDRAVRHFRNRAGSRTLRLAVRQTPLAARLGDVVGEVCPDDVVDLAVVDRQATVLAALADGTVDLALHVDFPGREPVLPAGIERTVVGPEPMFVMLATDHPLAGRDEVELSELAGSTWLLAVNGDDEFDRHLANQCELAGIGTITVRAYEPLVISQLLRRGDPVAVPAQALNTGLPLIGTVLSVRGAPVRVRHVLLWSKDGPIDAAVAGRVRDGLAAAYRSMVGPMGRVPGWWDRNPGWLGSPEPAPPPDAAPGPAPDPPPAAGHRAPSPAAGPVRADGGGVRAVPYAPGAYSATIRGGVVPHSGWRSSHA